MATIKPRQVLVNVTYNNKNISKDLRKYLKAVSYTDVMSGYADDLQLTLEDRQGLWQSSWIPDKGASLNVSLVNSAWQNVLTGQEEVNLGIFEIDEITSSGYPSEVQIKAVSVPENNTLRGEEHSRSWEKTTLKTIAQDIAAGAGLTLVYEVQNDIDLDRAEQTEQSDLSFLLSLCADQGLALKICKNQVVIFDEAEYEKADAMITLVKPGTLYDAVQGMLYINTITGYSFSSKIRDVYAACHVKYQQDKNKQLIEATFTAPGKQGKTLQVSEQVDSIAEAQRLAKKRLREKNCDEITGRINLMGSFSLMAAVTVQLLGFGAFDGKYIITQAQHDVGGGYTTGIDIRRCLDGY